MQRLRMLVFPIAVGFLSACGSPAAQAPDAGGQAGQAGAAGQDSGAQAGSGPAGGGEAGTGQAGAGGEAGMAVEPMDAATEAAATVDAAAETHAEAAPEVRDALPAPDAPAGTDAAKLQECTMPSIDRIQSWNATQGEGDMVPSGGSLLVKEGDHYVAKVTLNGTGWHVLPVYLSNAGGGGMVDLTTSAGFTLTYSTTADLWIQMRPANHWNGGVQWVTKIPSTGGAMQSRYFSLATDAWSYLQQLGGKPSWPYEEARAQVRGFVFVGNLPNTVVFAGLRFDAYVPACRP